MRVRDGFIWHPLAPGLLAFVILCFIILFFSIDEPFDRSVTPVADTSIEFRLKEVRTTIDKIKFDTDKNNLRITMLEFITQDIMMEVDRLRNMPSKSETLVNAEWADLRMAE